jgi:hypothetical protein
MEILTKLTERMKNSPAAQDYTLEARECVLWALNLLNELVNSAPETVATAKLNKEEAAELKRKEYTVSYFLN